MKKTINYIILAAAALSFAACSTDSDMSGDGNGSTPVNLRSAGIGTRGDVQSTQIVENEEVTAWMYKSSDGLGDELATNLKYTAGNNGTLTLQDNQTQVYFPTTGTIDIKALHGPYTSSHSDVADAATNNTRLTMNFWVSDEQNTETEYVKSDILYGASVGVAETSEAIPLTFYHILSKLELTVNTKGLDADIENIKIKDVVTEGTFTPDDSKLSSQSDRNAMVTAGTTQQSILLSNAQVNNSESNDAIMVPQSMAGKTIEFTLSNGVKYAYTFADDLTFEGGKKYSFTVNITASGVSLSFMEITEWETGDSGSGDATLKQYMVDKTTHTIKTFAAGQLTSDILDEAISENGELTVTGTVNSDDLKAITDKNEKLTVLDMSAASGTDLSLSQNAFRLSSVTSVKLPQGLTEIPVCAFSACRSLTSVSIPHGVTKIDNSAFQNCVSLVTIDLPTSLTTLDQYAFYQCSSLKTIDLSNVTSMSINAFTNCTSLESVTLSQSITSLDGEIFKNCSSLKSISLPGVTYIGVQAFDGCSSLEYIDIPSVENIQPNAFRNCTSLMAITIPSCTAVICEGVFTGCTSLTEITCLATTPPTLGGDLFKAFIYDDKPNPTDYTVYVPSESLDAYKAATNWSDIADKIVGKDNN